MQNVLTDIRYAIRVLFRSPGFAAIAILTLALGIAASTSIFTVVNAVLLRPLPFPDPERLVSIWQFDRLRATEREGFSGPDYLDVVERSSSFEGIAAINRREISLSRTDGDPERIAGAAVTHNYFALLGLNPVAGRTFSVEEDKPSAEKVVVLSEEFWRRQLSAADPSGQGVALNDVMHTVIGVVPAPPGSELDFWVPLSLDRATSVRGMHNLGVLGRIRQGITIDQAREDLNIIARDLEREFRDDNLGRGMTAAPLHEATVQNVRRVLFVLLAAVMLLLLIACANVANLLMARASGRRGEVALRSVLGAGKFSLLRQFMIENLVLTFLAGILGVLAASWGVKILLRMAPETLPRMAEVSVDAKVVLFAVAVCALTGILFGLVPLLESFRSNLYAPLRETGTRATSRKRHRAGRVLVVLEVALAVVLVIGAALVVQSFRRLMNVDLGFSERNIVKLELLLPESRYPQDFSRFPDWKEVFSFHERVLQELGDVPGVESAALAMSNPLDSTWTTRFQIEGRPPVEAGQQDEVYIRAVSPSYFETVGLRVLRGRALSDRDRPGTVPVIMVNSAFVRKNFGEGDPIGKRVSFFGTAREIVGVVDDERFGGLNEEIPAALYPSMHQAPMTQVTVLVRSEGDVMQLVPAVRKAIWRVDRDLALYEVQSLDAVVSDAVAAERFTMTLMGLFAIVALLLAAVGVHGILSVTVAQRTHEIGVRMAIGAESNDVIRVVVRDGMAMAGLGVILGLLGALVLTRYLGTMLFGIDANDPWTFFGVSAFLLTVAFLSSYLPARRASRVDPLLALRYE